MERNRAKVRWESKVKQRGCPGHEKHKRPLDSREEEANEEETEDARTSLVNEVKTA